MNGCLPEIRRRLGHRYRLLETAAPAVQAAGTAWPLHLQLTNDGFGKLYNPRPLDVVLEGPEGTFALRLIEDVRTWLPAPGETVERLLAVPLSDGLPSGTYNVYLVLPDRGLTDDPRYSIRLANETTWDEASGRNRLLRTLTVQPVSTEPPRDTSFGLETLAPNPVRETLTARLRLFESGPLLLTVFDVLGRRVTAHRMDVNPGLQEVTVPVRGLAPGSYVLRLQAGEHSLVTRFTVAP